MTYAVVEATSVNSSRGNLLLIWESGLTKVVQCNDVSPFSGFLEDEEPHFSQVIATSLASLLVQMEAENGHRRV